MADEEEYEELQFKMVNGETFRKRVPVGGEARRIFEDVLGTGWIDIDEKTRIQKVHVVSVRIRERAHERMPTGSLGD